MYIKHVESGGEGANNSQSDIDFGDTIAEPERSFGRGEMRLGPVQRLEENLDVLFVGLLRRGEPGLVDAVVDLVVLPLVRCIDLGLERLRVEVDFAILFVDDVVELRNGFC